MHLTNMFTAQYHQLTVNDSRNEDIEDYNINSLILN